MESVLLMRSGALGDTILTLPVLESIRAMRPGAAITFLAPRAYKWLAPPGVEFHAVDDLERLWLFGPETRPGGHALPPFDCAYLIMTRPEFVMERLRESGIAEVHHASWAPTPGKHMVELVHERLGLPTPPRRAALNNLQREAKQDLIWFHPGSGGARKAPRLRLSWRVVEHLRRLTGWPLAVTIGEADAFLEREPEWQEMVTAPETWLLKDQPLDEICVKLAGARLYVGNDSGVSHLAAGLGIRAMVFFTATDPAQWGPWAPSDQLRLVDLGGRLAGAGGGSDADLLGELSRVGEGLLEDG
jgi:ADP-heptose:LPS heptosyltransferase